MTEKFNILDATEAREYGEQNVAYIYAVTDLASREFIKDDLKAIFEQEPLKDYYFTEQDERNAFAKYLEENGGKPHCTTLRFF